MKWALLISLVAFSYGCDAGDSAAPQRVHVGCEAGSGCIEDMTIIGTCAQDRSHLCFCPPEAGSPGGECQDTVVKPYLPYTKAYCCP